MHVAVLMGGFSAEREVSLTSGGAVAKACRALGHQVSEIDVGHDVVEQLKAAKPDVAFNALHGTFGEDGRMQGILELLNIPYTHSGVLASALAMDKPMAKRMYAQAGLRIAHSIMATRDDVIAGDVMPRPYVVKPHNEGSSVGVNLMFADGNFHFTQANWPYGAAVMVEQYIPGRELTVAVLDGKALGVTEITIPSGFYDYENKYTAGKSNHICPAQIPATIYQEAMRMAEVAHTALGCRSVSRSDFRWDEDGDGHVYILETNTQPGMTPLSLTPELAAYAGMSFDVLVQKLLDGARLDG